MLVFFSVSDRQLVQHWVGLYYGYTMHFFYAIFAVLIK